MKRVLIFSVLLIVGLIGSQLLPALGNGIYVPLSIGIKLLTMVCLAFIMTLVGLAFTINKNNLRGYGWDYVVAATAATFPWILCAAYFVYVVPNPGVTETLEQWKEALVTGRFAAPTSAGVLFSMLAAAGLGTTWVFRKARILAIFDDLDTILLMIPLKMLIVGFQWEMLVILTIVTTFLVTAWRYMRKIDLPTSWEWILLYSVIITLICEAMALVHHFGGGVVPIQIEVLLPAFVLGVVMVRPDVPDDMEPSEVLEEEAEESFVAQVISGVFMLLVGLSMPPIVTGFCQVETSVEMAAMPDIIRRALELPAGGSSVVDFSGPACPVDSISWSMIAVHVLIVTVLSNLGKMFPAFCYRKEASFKERLALAIGMWPRGEVGAGVIVISLSFGISGPMVTIAVLSLALNLVLTGVFIAIVKRLVSSAVDPEKLKG